MKAGCDWRLADQNGKTPFDLALTHSPEIVLIILQDMTDDELIKYSTPATWSRINFAELPEGLLLRLFNVLPQDQFIQCINAWMFATSLQKSAFPILHVGDDRFRLAQISALVAAPSFVFKTDIIPPLLHLLYCVSPSKTQELLNEVYDRLGRQAAADWLAQRTPGAGLDYMNYAIQSKGARSPSRLLLPQ